MFYLQKITFRKTDVPIHEHISVGILLALVGGFLDAYTYLLHGAVFANAQTGNIVLMSMRIAESDWLKAIYYLIPILAFALGVVVTELIKALSRKSSFLKWRYIIVGMESAILFLLGILPAATPSMVITVTISFICSVQVCSFRSLSGVPYATTMCTGNLRSATEQLCAYIKTKDKTSLHHSGRYFFIIFCFCAGAAAGVLACNLWAGKSIWLCSVLLLLTLLLLLLDSNKKTEIPC